MVKVSVSVENFNQAESHHYMKKIFNKVGKTNKFLHYRNFNLDNSVIRMNLDTLYSMVILDSKKDNLIITIPNIKDRYFSCCIIDDEHYEVFYTKKSGSYIFAKSPKYYVCLIRILVKKRTESEIKQVNKLQDLFKIEATSYSKTLKLPDYDQQSYSHTRNLIAELYQTAPTMSSLGMFGKRCEVSDLKHLLGTEMGWGGLNSKYAYYETFIPDNNDGKQEYCMTFREIPVKAFWSFIVYDKDGYIIDYNHCSINNFMAKQNKDGNYTINFSNNTNKINNLKISKDWNFTIRLYEPSKDVLDKKWKFPKLQKTS